MPFAAFSAIPRRCALAFIGNEKRGSGRVVGYTEVIQKRRSRKVTNRPDAPMERFPEPGFCPASSGTRPAHNFRIPRHPPAIAASTKGASDFPQADFRGYLGDFSE